jgi:hypothetical protein
MRLRLLHAQGGAAALGHRPAGGRKAENRVKNR